MNQEILTITDELHLDPSVQMTAYHLLDAWDIVCSDNQQYHIDRGPASAACVLFAGLDAGFPITLGDVQDLSSHHYKRVATQEALMREGMNITHSSPPPGDYAQEYIIRLDAELELGLGSDAVDPAVNVAEAGRPYMNIKSWQVGAGAVLKTTDVTINEVCEVAHCDEGPILGSLTELPKNVH